MIFIDATTTPMGRDAIEQYCENKANAQYQNGKDNNQARTYDTRDTEAIKRIATGYLKLLFPHVRSPKDINSLEFTKYCLRPATKMRQIIKMQLGILDTEYKGKDVPTLTVRSEYGN